jgi:all-trans-retinol dehydrogenase (NAD+)
MDIKGKRAVVTGGARGIGFAIVRRLIREGCIVTIWDLKEDVIAEAMKDVAVAFGPAAAEGLFGHVCDVTDPARVLLLADTARNEMGGVDILINNAGYLSPGDFLDGPVENWIRTLDINVNALVYTTHAFLPAMYERNSGHIVNISSAAGLIGVPGLAVYSASKWAVLGLTESLRHEAHNRGKTGVRFSSIHPNYVRTGLFAGARLSGIGSLIFPQVPDHDVVAKAVVVSALKKGRHSPKRPRTVRLSLVFRGILPDFLFQKLVRFLGVASSMSTWKGCRDEK